MFAAIQAANLGATARSVSLSRVFDRAWWNARTMTPWPCGDQARL
jgi:hypothetical protein